MQFGTRVKEGGGIRVKGESTWVQEASRGSRRVILCAIELVTQLKTQFKVAISVFNALGQLMHFA
jgi:hypothetical protein